MAKSDFRKIRGISDQDLHGALTHHAQVLGAIGKATTMLLKERRLLLVWGAVVTLAVVFLAVTR